MPAIDSLLKPIPGPQPTGVSLRYDPIYDKLKEARREEAGVPEWDVKPKVPDWPQVVRLASEALSAKSKDLQIAAWLTEALLRQEGIKGLRDGLTLLHGLIERYWDGLFPEVEDGDAEFRAAPLQWIGDYLVAGVRMAPLSKAGHNALQYAESRTVGYETDLGEDETKQEARKAVLAEGKLAPEEFDKGFEATPKAWYKTLIADLAGALEALKALDATGTEKFGDGAPSYMKLRGAIEDVQRVVEGLLAKKLETDPDPGGGSGAGRRCAGDLGGADQRGGRRWPDRRRRAVPATGRAAQSRVLPHAARVPLGRAARARGQSRSTSLGRPAHRHSNSPQELAAGREVGGAPERGRGGDGNAVRPRMARLAALRAHGVRQPRSGVRARGACGAGRPRGAAAGFSGARGRDVDG
jgi:type VI secretion system ImpA family protein